MDMMRKLKKNMLIFEELKICFIKRVYMILVQMKILLLKQFNSLEKNILI